MKKGFLELSYGALVTTVISVLFIILLIGIGIGLYGIINTDEDEVAEDSFNQMLKSIDEVRQIPGYTYIVSEPLSIADNYIISFDQRDNQYIMDELTVYKPDVCGDSCICLYSKIDEKDNDKNVIKCVNYPKNVYLKRLYLEEDRANVIKPLTVSGDVDEGIKSPQEFIFNSAPEGILETSDLYLKFDDSSNTVHPFYLIEKVEFENNIHIHISIHPLVKEEKIIESLIARESEFESLIFEYDQLILKSKEVLSNSQDEDELRKWERILQGQVDKKYENSPQGNSLLFYKYSMAVKRQLLGNPIVSIGGWFDLPENFNELRKNKPLPDIDNYQLDYYADTLYDSLYCASECKFSDYPDLKELTCEEDCKKVADLEEYQEESDFFKIILGRAEGFKNADRRKLIWYLEGFEWDKVDILYQNEAYYYLCKSHQFFDNMAEQSKYFSYIDVQEPYYKEAADPVDGCRP